MLFGQGLNMETRLNGGHDLPSHGWNRVDLSAKKRQRHVSTVQVLRQLCGASGGGYVYSKGYILKSFCNIFQVVLLLFHGYVYCGVDIWKTTSKYIADIAETLEV